MIPLALMVFAAAVGPPRPATASNAIVAIEGDLPAGIGTPTAAVWIGPDGPVAGACEIAALRWRCVHPDGATGLVAIFGDGGVAFAAVRGGATAAFTHRRWGAAVVLAPRSAPPEDLRGARLSAVRPDRSEHRPRTVRFYGTPQPDVDVIDVSSITFFVAGDDVDRDAFLTVEGPAFASTRVPLAAVAHVSDRRIDVPIDAPETMNGRVVDLKGQGVESATVNLFIPMTWHSPGADSPAAPPADPDERVFRSPAIKGADVRTGPGGLFTFDHLGTGPFVVTASHPDGGRRTLVAESALQPIELRLEPLPQATGRVTRHHAPVAGASVRFVPDVAAFTTSTDPGQMASEPRTSGEEGRFAIRLPPDMSGSLVIVAPDRTTVRVRVQKPASGLEIALGDIPLPDLLKLTVRLIDLVPCEMSAAGPLGSLGLSTVKGSQASNTYLFELPEPGEWVLNASCGGRSLALQPQVVSVGADRSSASAVIDVRIAR